MFRNWKLINKVFKDKIPDFKFLFWSLPSQKASSLNWNNNIHIDAGTDNSTGPKL